jgi:hypothetical protein
MWGILKTNAVALERGEGKKAGMEVGLGGRSYTILMLNRML